MYFPSCMIFTIVRIIIKYSTKNPTHLSINPDINNPQKFHFLYIHLIPDITILHCVTTAHHHWVPRRQSFLHFKNSNQNVIIQAIPHLSLANSQTTSLKCNQPCNFILVKHIIHNLKYSNKLQ